MNDQVCCSSGVSNVARILTSHKSASLSYHGPRKKPPRHSDPLEPSRLSILGSFRSSHRSRGLGGSIPGVLHRTTEESASDGCKGHLSPFPGVDLSQTSLRRTYGFDSVEERMEPSTDLSSNLALRTPLCFCWRQRTPADTTVTTRFMHYFRLF